MAFAKRMGSVPRSFIREILKVTQDASVISFAGGLPNPAVFPAEALRRASEEVLTETGPEALQYATTEGYLPLREAIAERYRRVFGFMVDPMEVIITTGSQQGLDLVGKVFMDPGDKVLLERPGYLGAIQAFSIFEPRLVQVPLTPKGVDTRALEEEIERGPAKLFYCVPTFQNPSGLTYDLDTRQKTVEILARHDTLLVEDDPYGEIRFRDEPFPPMASLSKGETILFGSFSKVAAPGLRIGWIVAKGESFRHLVTAKQASDLHTSSLTQRILHRFLVNEDLDAHLAGVRAAYKRQCDYMVEALRAHFPAEVSFTEPEGGMFIWVTLPEGASSLALFDLAVKRKVAFVPGTPFDVNGGGQRTLRLNFSNSDEARIEEGVKRLGECLREHLATAAP